MHRLEELGFVIADTSCTAPSLPTISHDSAVSMGRDTNRASSGKGTGWRTPPLAM